MGFRFRKSIKVAPGVRLNLSKSGVSGSVSAKGTGLSYSTASRKRKASERGWLGNMVVGTIVLVGLVWIVAKLIT